jgi:outer membrane biosynthesis protein TonB
MKAVLDLTKAIKNKIYYDEQFDGSGTEKNILFVSPQLTSKHLYKFILPFFSFYTKKVHTAITDLSKYNPYEQIVQLDTTLTRTEILWANYIVFPFTTMDLTKQYGLYDAIREVNPSCKIVFFVDFNYYSLPADHPHKELFDFPNIVDSTEKNVLMADLCLVSNLNLQMFLVQKFTELVQTKYKSIEHIPVMFNAIPYLIDDKIVLQNVEFEANKPEPVINKDLFKKMAEVAEEIKKEDLSTNKEKAKKIANSKPAPKKKYEKTKKVVAKRGRKKKEEEVIVAPVSEENKEINPTEQTDTVPQGTDVTNTNNTVQQEASVIVTQLPKKYRIGIICSPNNYTDIKVYNDEFRKINEKYGDNVTLIFIGYDYKEDKGKILDGVNFEYIEQVSIIQYFKQLQSLALDLIFIPLDRSLYNVTSENINKYMEGGLFNIPLIVDDMFPYNQIILSERNGFLYKTKQNFITELDKILNNPDLIKVVSIEVKNDVLRSYTYSDNNIGLIASVYS